MTIFKKHDRYALNLEEACWVAPNSASAPPAEPDLQDPKIQQEIDDLPCHLADVMGPKVPPLSLAAVEELAARHLTFKWQPDVVHGLVMYEPAIQQDRVQAKARLAEVTWKALYRVAAGRHHPYDQQQPAADQHDGVPAGPPSACFRCGLYGRWARECVTQPLARPWSSTRPNIGVAPRELSVGPPVSYASSPSFTSVHNSTRPRGGLSMVRTHTVYTTASTGRTYKAPAVPVCSVPRAALALATIFRTAADHQHPRGSAPSGPRPPGPGIPPPRGSMSH